MLGFKMRSLFCWRVGGRVEPDTFGRRPPLMPVGVTRYAVRLPSSFVPARVLSPGLSVIPFSAGNAAPRLRGAGSSPSIARWCLSANRSRGSLITSGFGLTESWSLSNRLRSGFFQWTRIWGTVETGPGFRWLWSRRLTASGVQMSASLRSRVFRSRVVGPDNERDARFR